MNVSSTVLLKTLDRRSAISSLLCLPACLNAMNSTPSSDFAAPEIHDARLAPVMRGAALERLCTGATWSEGPVWMHEDACVLWSDIPANRILRWSTADGMTVWRDGVDFTNGHARERNGDLLHCSHGRRAIVRTRCGPLGVSADALDDVVVRSDGTIWFTDPPYGILSDREGHQAPSEQAANHVFCFDPRTGELSAATNWVEEPNGLAFSPDERTLYVSDTSAALKPGAGKHRIVAFDVTGNRLSAPRVVADIAPGLPDGFRIDHHGWIYTSSEDAVQVLAPDGTRLGRIPVPEKVGNLTFGGPSRNELYIAASTSLYRITLQTLGIQTP
jgi:gluconolactonase